MASAATFSVGAAAPLALLHISSRTVVIPVVAGGPLVFLALLGIVGAKANGAHVLKPMIRVTLRGAHAMAPTTGIGALFETVG